MVKPTDQIYMSIQGARQGRFNGDGGNKLWKSRLKSAGMATSAFQFGVESPRDSSSGQASGKRQHKPVTIVKEWGAASPQLLQALVTNEVLQVVFEWAQADSAGNAQVYRTIRLANATVTSIRSKGTPAPKAGHGTALHTHEIEEIQLVFEKIEIDNKGSKDSMSDDWSK